MENILIECSEKQSYQPNPNINGDFRTIFKQPHYVYEGDEVAISKCFIDNETSSDGLIVIKNDLNCFGTVALYNTNGTTTKLVSTGDGEDINDNQDYVVCEIITPGTGNYPKMIRVKALTAIALGKNFMGDKTNGERPMKVNYIDVLGNKRSFYVEIKYYTDGTTEEESNEIFIFAQKGSLTADDTNGNYGFNNVLAQVMNEIPSGGINMGDGLILTSFDAEATFSKPIIAPYNYNFGFGVPSGKYLPADLATLINDKMTLNLVQDGFIPGFQVLSPFLTIYNQILNARGTNIPGDAKVLLVNGYNDVNGNVTNGRTMKIKPTNFIGTNIIDLQFDTTDQKFYWNQLHFPFYDDGTPATQIKERAGAGDYINVRKNGGIVFTQLGCLEDLVDKDGNPSQQSFDFWQGVLGFNEHTLVAGELAQQDFTDGSGTVYHGSRLDTREGITTTNAKNTLDEAVSKTDFEVVPISGFNPITSKINTVIKAQTPAVSGDILSSGYFMVQMDCGFTNTIVSTNSITQNINAIVSRYYSLGSYTSTSLDPSMIYTHRGEPILLTEANITILNSDRTIANVGDDNTIFIEIVRGQYYKQLMMEQYDAVGLKEQQEQQQQQQQNK